MLFCDRVKIFTDGGLGASTAALLEPYSDDPAGKNRGILTITPEQLDIALDNAAEAGFREVFNSPVSHLNFHFSVTICRNSQKNVLFHLNLHFNL